MIDHHWKQSIEGLESPRCPDCHVRMLRYRSILLSDSAPETVAHFFQCAGCHRLLEQRMTVEIIGRRSDPRSSLQPDDFRFSKGRA